jgi:hypothetical protein
MAREFSGRAAIVEPGPNHAESGAPRGKSACEREKDHASPSTAMHFRAAAAWPLHPTHAPIAPGRKALSITSIKGDGACI